MIPRPAILLFPFILLLCSCEAEEERLYTFKEPHMGTEFTLRIYAKQGSVKDLTLLSRRVFDRVAELNQIFSDYLPESEVNDLARAPVGEAIPVSDDLFRIFDLAKQLSEETKGAFDVTAGPLVRLWRMSRKNQKLPTPEQIARAKARTGSDLLDLDPVARTVTKRSGGMLFDLGGIAKGYAADEALSLLKEAGYSRSLVAASGDIVVGDAPPGKAGWRIGIETLDVGAPLENLDTVTLVNQAISTSADTRRYFEHEGARYSHIVSTETGLGLTHRIGASVIAPDATTSDSYATAVTILGAEEGLQFIENRPEVECRIVLLKEGEEAKMFSAGFPR
jgi:thiamine biosynthesis lipoprotein